MVRSSEEQHNEHHENLEKCVSMRCEDFPVGGFLKIGGNTPKWMVYMENPIKMDDLGVPPFKETSSLGASCWFEDSEWTFDGCIELLTPKNHWTLLGSTAKKRGLDVYSRGLGCPNHQFWDPMIQVAKISTLQNMDSWIDGCLLNDYNMQHISWNMMYDTVDGRNPAPVDIANIPLFAGFFTSQLVQDFFNQQYVYIYIYTSCSGILRRGSSRNGYPQKSTSGFSSCLSKK